jgi:hypothetical protein
MKEIACFWSLSLHHPLDKLVVNQPRGDSQTTTARESVAKAGGLPEGRTAEAFLVVDTK